MHRNVPGSIVRERTRKDEDEEEEEVATAFANSKLIFSKYDALESVLAFLNRRKVLAGIDIVCSTVSSISKINFNRETFAFNL